MSDHTGGAGRCLRPVAGDDPIFWRELGQQLRVDAVRAAAEAGSGHPTSGMSAADLMAVLLAKYLRYDFDDPKDPHNDRLVFSKGHASTLLYAMFRAAGAISDDELLSYRQFGPSPSRKKEPDSSPHSPNFQRAEGSPTLNRRAQQMAVISSER